jgi:hypothetical protein
LAETLADLPRRPVVQVREFYADTAGEARNAAAEWLRDFEAHGPLDIENIQTSRQSNRFVTVVAYWAS